MPVKFRGVSEYTSTYQWSPSYRSAQFEPTPQQASPEAGLRSDEMNYLLEPNFATKRRVPHRKPEAGYCLFWPNDNYDDSGSEQGQPLSEVSDRNKNLKTYVVKPKQSKVKNRTSVTDKKSKENKKSPERKSSNLNESLSTWEKSEQQYQQKSSINDSSVMKHKEKVKKPILESEINSNTIVKSSRPAKRKEVDGDVKRSPGKQKRASPKKETNSNNVPLKYRPLHHRMLSAHQTEYQKMYTKPTRFIPSSPLISALDVVHASSPAIPPHKSPKMQTKSEYSSKFRGRSSLSKSLPSFSSPASPSMKLKIKDLPSSAYPQRQHSPQKIASEYAKQYSDRDFSIEQQAKVLDEARHNKLNREGTGFDRDHLNQLYSRSNKCWDMSSASGSNVATSEGENAAGDKHSQKKKALLKESINREPDEDEVESIVTIEKDSLDAASTLSNENIINSKPLARKLAWDEQDEDDDSTVAGTITPKNEATNGYEGRLPTPHLNEIGGAVRTHHDLTTPCAGGALLTSPENSFKKSKAHYRPASNTSTSTVRSSSSIKHEINKVDSDNSAKSSQFKQRDCTPAKPAAAKLNKTSPAKRISEPVIPRRLLQTVRVPIQGALRNQEFQHCGKNSRPTSTMEHLSLASLRSAASVQNLLQKSMQRQNFWKDN